MTTAAEDLLPGAELRADGIQATGSSPAWANASSAPVAAN